MPIPAVIATVGTMIVDGVIKHFQRKDELRQAQHEAEIVEVRREAEQAGKLDELSLMQRSWKDEYLLLITTAPLVLLFFAPIASISSLADINTAVREGFIALESTPEYYWWALGLIYVDTFGFRQMMRGAFQLWVQKRLGGEA